MSEQRQPYEIMECTQCGAIIESPLLPRAFEEKLAEIAGGPVPVSQYHRRNEARGSGIPGMIGCHMVVVDCGPVVKRTVSVQEQFVNWLEDSDGRRTEDDPGGRYRGGSGGHAIRYGGGR